jgi:hypothetical protein
LILHSPGGSPEAAEAFVNYLRSKFKNIRAIVPQAAMSAATMIACACDEIVLGKHSALGPIDPQFIMATQSGVQVIPAQAILDQWEGAKEQCGADPSLVPVWYPILSQYGPALLEQCRNAIQLSQTLVAEWLQAYMFLGDEASADKAKCAAQHLAAHNEHHSHARHLSRDVLYKYGLKIVPLEDDQKLQDLALSVFHATMHTFTHTLAAKIVENHTGSAFLKAQGISPSPTEQA